MALVALLHVVVPDGGVATGDAGPAHQRQSLSALVGDMRGAKVTSFRVATMIRPGEEIHGQAAEVERARLRELGPLASCPDRACLVAALARCKPARLDVYEQRGHCAMEEPRLPLHAWYAVAKRKGGRCEVLMFGSRGAQVVTDRWCRGVPLEDYDLSCPDDPEVKRMASASQPVMRPKRR